MAYKYEIPSGGDSIQRSAGIVIGVVPLESKNTFDFQTRKSKSDIKVADLSVESTPFQIQDRCISAIVTADKSSFTWNFNGNFKDSDDMLFQSIAPGDWICVWMVNSRVKAKEISGRIAEQKAAVGFDDGLKFWGRVESIRQTQIVSETGTVVKRVAMTAHAFRELGSAIYFNPALESRADKDFGFAHVLAMSIKDWETSIHDATFSGVMDAIPAIIYTFLGAGPPSTLKQLSAAAPQRSPNDAFLVPKTIGSWLGRSSPTEKLTFCDCIDIHIGVEEYNDSGFAPMLQKHGIYNTYKSGLDITSAFSPMLAPLNGIIWNILNGYINDKVNEMFPVLRVVQKETEFITEFVVTPTLVIRQKPFTTAMFVNKAGDRTDDQDTTTTDTIMPVTRYDSLPRWVISPKLITALNVGRSNALRCNYVHVVAMPPMETVVKEFLGVTQQALARFVIDDRDIQRSGLRMELTTILAESTQSDIAISDFWSALVADWRFGGHLKLNGSMSVIGIEEPINPGDNLEYQDTIYHIEGFTHSFVVGGDGLCHFQTELNLTNGILIESKRDSAAPNELWPKLAP